MANMTAVGFPPEQKVKVLELFSLFCCPIQAAFMVGEPLCDLETTSWTLEALLKVR